jgi:Uma2 family endonuclease
MTVTVNKFLAWAERQEQGKYELIDGIVIEEPGQTWGHTKTRMQALVALREAIDWGPSTFYVAPNGPTVRVNEHTAFAPDALVAPLPEPAFDSLEIPNPIIVVEVLSPSTVRMDTTTKVSGYFKVASVQHYLIVDPGGRSVTHHKRGSSAVVKTRIVRKGVLALNPPGIKIRLADVFGPAGP